KDRGEPELPAGPEAVTEWEREHLADNVRALRERLRAEENPADRHQGKRKRDAQRAQHGEVANRRGALDAEERTVIAAPLTKFQLAPCQRPPSSIVNIKLR